MNKWINFSFAARGKSHLSKNEPCQDFVRGFVDYNRACCVLCDGAGSAKYSLSAAASISNYTVNMFAKNGILPTEIILGNIRGNLEKLAKKKKAEFSEFASTFLAVFVDEDRYKVIHIGDGLIGAIDLDGIKVLSMGYKGEFSNETIFITSPNVERCIFEREGNIVQEGIFGFILMSDGMQQAVFNKSSGKFGEFIFKVYNHIENITEPNYLRKMKLRIKRKGKPIFYQKTFDDFSIGLLRRI